MHLDPMLPRLVGALLAVLLTGLLLRRLRLPHVVIYLLAGLIVGPGGLDIIGDREMLSRVGELGVLLLLFFVGMEVSLPRLLEGWRLAVIGTVVQVAVTVGVVFAVGAWQDWPSPRILLIGFVLSLSSTAVVINRLRVRNESDTLVGRDVIGVLLVQDLLVIPMIMVLSSSSGDGPHTGELVRQLVGGVLIVALVWRLLTKPPSRIWGLREIAEDSELALFGGLTICLGLSLFTALFGLSTAMGAFVAGIALSAIRQTEWIHHRLESFRVLFLAIFFASVGAMLDLTFLAQNWGVVVLLSLVALAVNMVVNTLILRAFKRSWGHAVYGGALLAAIGEFSFVLAAVGRTAGLISDTGYQLTVAIICVTLAVSAGWVALMTRITHHGGIERAGPT